MSARRDTDSTGSEYAAERPKAFVDAVVAIALTLLILPLMESVGEVAGAGEDTLAWFGAHSSQLWSFVLSFVLIAMFWMIHHSAFAAVRRVTPVLMWLLGLWMLTIVWLPVATAISGRMQGDDVVARMVYAGSLACTALVSVVLRLYLRAHPGLHRCTPAELHSGLSHDVSMLFLFSLVFVITSCVPGVGYAAFFIMLLSGLSKMLFARLLPGPSGGPPGDQPAGGPPSGELPADGISGR